MIQDIMYYSIALALHWPLSRQFILQEIIYKMDLLIALEPINICYLASLASLAQLEIFYHFPVGAV